MSSGVHTLFPNLVSLDKEQHRYFHVDGREFISFSKIYGFLVEKFDAEAISAATAKRDNVSQESVKAKWNNATDEGTRLDQAFKLYSQTGQILIENSDLQDIIKEMSIKYKDYSKTYEDLVIYNEDYRTAGEIDRLALTSKLKTCDVHVMDIKRFENGMTYEPKGQKWLNYPFSHFPNTRYTKVTFQLSFYAWHYEKLTGQKIGRLFVDVVKVVDGKMVNETVPVQYIKTDIELLLETFKHQVNAILNPAQVYQF